MYSVKKTSYIFTKLVTFADLCLSTFQNNLLATRGYHSNFDRTFLTSMNNIQR